jgi:hypothetical protein
MDFLLDVHTEKADNEFVSLAQLLLCELKPR